MAFSEYLKALRVEVRKNTLEKIGDLRGLKRKISCGNAQSLQMYCNCSDCVVLCNRGIGGGANG